MSVNSKMTAIANAIRAKRGISGVLSLDQMATEISNIAVADHVKHWTITLSSRLTTNKTIVSGDSDVAAHYTDANAMAFIMCREPAVHSTSGKRMAIMANRTVYTATYYTYKGVAWTSGNGSALVSNNSLASGTDDNKDSIRANGNGDIIINASASSNSYNWLDGTYDVIFIW